MPLNNKAKLLNILTMLGILLGLIAIIFFILLDLFIYGSILLFISALIDRYDGKLARKYHIENDFGKALDSFNDLISFIIAPIILLYQLNIIASPFICIFGPLIFVTAGIFRLARFAGDETNQTVQGLPTTLSGILLIVSINSIHLLNITNAQWFIFILLIGLALLMIAKFRVKKI